MPSVIFVCTGNTCRSPMAMALFLEKLSKAGLPAADWKVDSAGTWAADGLPATRLALQTLALRNLDLTQHRSKIVTGELLDDYDLILTMEAGHKEALRVEFPSLARRVFMLSEMAGRRVAIEDPIGGGPEDYQRAAREIESWLEQGWEKILRHAQR